MFDPAAIYAYLSTRTLKELFLLIGAWYSNPLVPDFGTQLLTAAVIGMIIPEPFVKPLSSIVERILDFAERKGVPGVRPFRRILKKYKRVRTVVPRIFAGYVITYAIGWTLLFIGYFIL